MSTIQPGRETNGPRSIGLLGATAIGIGGRVGGGIVAVLGVASEQAGGATPIAFAVAGLLNILLWAGHIVTTALYASAFGSYAATLFPGAPSPIRFCFGVSSVSE